MKIKCTVKEFGQLVRACEKGTCFNCALRELCKQDGENERTIEDFITADTITDKEEGAL